MQLKWGIVGTGNICQDFCLALLTCDPLEHIIVAVSSRNKEQADNFVKAFNLGDQVHTYGSQEELFQDPNVDITYIGTIEQVHRDLCVKALTNNKHVLCEKPLAMNVAEVQDIIDTARKTNKFMMEAMWSRFFPIYDYLRDAVKQIGTVTYVECTFCVPDLVSRGCWSTLMGIGCYPIQAALIAFDHEEPVAVVSAGHTQDYQGGKTDIMATIILLFKNNRMAVLNCLGQQISEINSLTIYGTEGVVRLPTHFWSATRIILPNGQSVEHPLPDTAQPTHYVHSAGLRYEAMACREQIMNGKVEHPYMTLENSLQIARIIEQARNQILQSKNDPILK